MLRYHFVIHAIDANDQTCIADGYVEVSTAGQFQQVLDSAQRMAFEQITGGRAIYGRPGVGCTGPYRFTKLLVEEET